MQRFRKAVLTVLVALSLPAMAGAETVTIAALGDSITQGYGLPAEDGLVPQLESWLRERGHDVTLINAGVSGDTTAGGLSRVGWTLTPEVDAMIVALGGNDMLRGIDPANVRFNLDGILKAARDAGVEVLLVGYQSPGNYGPAYKKAFDNAYPELAGKYRTLYLSSFLAGIANPPDVRTLMRKYMQQDGLHPNARGVGLMVQSLGPSVEALMARAAE
ncbi:acyl-CoA thioesterase-1 [Aliiruegeria haliotis]|uniref:Acyl-CoA thioesterase-1 n=1 Tax=Aliiruegeria haliotis TaxID=1280846 RepID=A0A2T0RPY6_9RHOB|nr:acyl-CoA thioesterase-1 [Aliiruegeria haliotis]